MPDNKDSLDGKNLIDGSVTEAKLAANAVTNTKIKNGSVTATKIATNTITSTQLANAAVNNGAIQSFAVTEEKIAAGAVAAAKIKDKAVSYNKVNFTKVYSTDHTFSWGARNGFHYPVFLTEEQFLQPFKWKWVVTVLDIDGPNKNIYIRNCSHLDNTVETGLFWFEYCYRSGGKYMSGVQVDNRAGAAVSVRVELYRWD